MPNSPDCILRSGIGAIKEIEQVLKASLRAGLLLPLTVDNDCPPTYDVQNAYALDLGCPECRGQWHYDWTEHEFFALVRTDETEPVWRVPQEKRSKIIKLAERQLSLYEAFLSTPQEEPIKYKAKHTCG